jgi:hypothetical protein
MAALSPSLAPSPAPPRLYARTYWTAGEAPDPAPGRRLPALPSAPRLAAPSTCATKRAPRAKGQSAGRVPSSRGARQKRLSLV